VSAGEFHACAVRTDGVPFCWGANDNGEAVPPAGTFTQISAGRTHSCGLRNDGGTAACWGTNGNGEASAPAGTFTAISAGGFHTCALRPDATLACWGAAIPAPPGGAFTQVDTGYLNACALRTDAAIVCWGNNDQGQSTPPSIDLAIAAHITSAPSATFALGSPGSFTVTTSGTPTPTLTRTGALPAGVTFVDNYDGTATLAGTPTAGGDFPITITAHNSALPDATQSFVLHVTKIGTKLTKAPVSIVGSVLGLKVTHTATLTRTDTNTPIAGQLVTFSILGQTQCTGTTNAQGVATCSTHVLSTVSVLLAGMTTATYAGNGTYTPATTATPNALL
jgi:hypothetical protein